MNEITAPNEIKSISLSYLQWVHAEFCSHPHYPQDVVSKQKEILESIKKRNKRSDYDPNRSVSIRASDLEFFQFKDAANQPIPTSQEQWTTMSIGARHWLEKRMENLDNFIVDTDDETQLAPCFFCGKYVQHINFDGNAWWAAIHSQNGEKVFVNYCNDRVHNGPDHCDESHEAYYKALWYEDNTYDIIGFQGHKYNMLTNPIPSE